MSRILFLVFSIVTFNLVAHATIIERTSCQTMAQPVQWSYCMTENPGHESGDVVYFLHGLGGSASEWSQKTSVGEAVEATWSQANILVPRVISISFGNAWLLAQKNPSSNSGLLEAFVYQIIPYIEQNVYKHTGRRIVFGRSMGGFNASQLILKFPALFDRAVLACPAISTLSPFATELQIQQHILETGANEFRVRGAIQLAKSFFADEASWNLASPILLAATKLGNYTPPTHVSCGNTDGYGFYTGASMFAQIGQMQSAPITWKSLQGGHCTMDPADIAQFLVKQSIF